MRFQSRPSPHLALVLLLVVPPVPASGQQPSSDEGRGAGWGHAFLGYRTLDLEETNGRLGAAGFPELDDVFVTVGGGGFGTRGRFLLGVEGFAMLSNEATTADGAHRVDLSGGYGLLRAGYLVRSDRDLDLYPAVGVGGGALLLGLVERSSPTFGEVLEDPARSSRLSSTMLLLDLSVSANYRIRVQGREPEGGGGPLLGIQVGWTFAPGTSSWELDGLNDVAGGPDLDVAGGYVRVTVGGWGRGGR